MAQIRYIKLRGIENIYQGIYDHKDGLFCAGQRRAIVMIISYHLDQTRATILESD